MFEVPRDVSHIITDPEDLPIDVTYSELIGQLGGKAAGLLWIQKHLPDVPTARMIVAAPEADFDETIEAARSQGLKFPWIVRASTPLDNLPGYEDYFPTMIIEQDIEADIRRKAGIVGHSPMYKGVQDIEKATIIIAELSKSPLRGTLIAHPHLDDFFMANVTWHGPEESDRAHAYYRLANGMSERSENLSLYSTDFIPEKTDNQVAQLIPTYQKIVGLPGLDGDMTLQIEFGIDPFLVFQIRDFLPRQRADFTLPTTHLGRNRNGERIPTVFGITPPEGVVARIGEYDSSWHVKTIKEGNRIGRDYYPRVKEIPEHLASSVPVAVISEPREIHNVLFSRGVNLFENGFGALAHQDIQAIRTTPLTIYNWDLYYGYDAQGTRHFLKEGDLVRIISDGERVVFEVLETAS